MNAPTRTPYGKDFAEFDRTSFSWQTIESPAFTTLLDYAYGWPGSHKRRRYTKEQPRILDLGCGSGRIIDKLYLYTDSYRITGLDISREVTEYSTPRLSSASWIIDDVRNLPKHPWVGEGVTAHMFFHLLPKLTLRLLFERLHDRLTDNGIITFGVPHIHRINQRDLDNRSAVTVATPWGSTEIVHPRTADDYALLLTRAGYRVERALEPILPRLYRRDPRAQAYLGGPSRLFMLARKV